jgi:Glycosyl transferase family 2
VQDAVAADEYDRGLVATEKTHERKAERMNINYASTHETKTATQSYPYPLVTTVIPTYRRPYMLRRAIRSVLDQTYPYFKICVYDNASKDETAEVVKALALRDSRIYYHCHQKNIGAQANFVYGLSRIETPLFNLLSDDDFLLPGFFAEAVSALQSDQGAGFFFGGVLSADLEGQVMGFPHFKSEAGQTCSVPRLFQLLAPNTRTWTSILFRRPLLKFLDGLKTETSYAADSDFILRSAVRYRAVLSNTPCAVFTFHPESTSVSRFPETFESLLSLALFHSINQAIDDAFRDNILTESDVAEMKAAFRKAAERGFCRGAFGLLARGCLPVADKTSEVLAMAFKRKNLAAVIHAAALDNGVGALLRFAIRSVRVTRSIWFTRNSKRCYPVQSKLVRDRLLELA